MKMAVEAGRDTVLLPKMCWSTPTILPNASRSRGIAHVNIHKPPAPGGVPAFQRLALTAPAPPSMPSRSPMRSAPGPWGRTLQETADRDLTDVRSGTPSAWAAYPDTRPDTIAHTSACCQDSVQTSPLFPGPVAQAPRKSVLRP